jgi:hypothetical protein
MADKKISALTAATTPLAGSEVLPIVQGASTVKVSVNNLTAGKTVPASALTITAPTYGNSGSIANPNDPNDEVLFTITNGANTNGGIARGGGTVLSLRDRTSNSGSATIGYGLYVTAPYDGTNASGSTYALTKYGIFVDDIYNFYGQNATVGSTNYGLYVKGGGRNYLKADTQFDNNVVIGTAAKGITTGSAISFGLGTNGVTTHATIHNSSGVSIGNTTDPGSTNLSVTGSTTSALFKTATGGPVSALNGVFVTVYTFPNAAESRLYVVYTSLVSVGDAVNFGRGAYVTTDAASAAIHQEFGGLAMDMQMVGLNLQALQISGGTQNIYATVTRLA